MKVDVKKIDPVKREMKFEVPKERVSQKLEEVYKDLGKVAKIKGFRQGKVPRHILETEHGALAKEEVLRKIIPEACQESLDKEKMFPLDVPQISDVNYKDGVITFTAKFEVRPEVKVKDYKGLKVKKKSNEVSEEDLNKTLDYFKKGQGKEDVAIDDSFARGLGFPSLEEFKKSMRRQLEFDKERQNRMDVENQIVDALLKRAKLVTPQSLVDRQMEKRMEEITQRLKAQGLPDDKIKEREETSRKELRQAVEKDVKVYFILCQIAEMEKIELGEKDNVAVKVMEFLMKEAQWEEAKA